MQHNYCSNQLKNKSHYIQELRLERKSATLDNSENAY